MNPKVKNVTGPKIRLLRKQRGWTQDKLAVGETRFAGRY
jgi:DNA-binding XRE family transcriptional regulator